MKKKILAISLVVSLVAIAALGATLAYFTDESSVANTFTMGDISIELEEIVGYDGETPIVKTEDDGGFEYENLVPGDSVVKKPYVKNTSADNDAWVFMKIELTNAKAVKAAIEKYDDSAAVLSDADFFTAIFNQLVVNGNWTDWDVVPTYSWDDDNFIMWFAYQFKLEAASQTVALFDGVKIPTAWDQDDLTNMPGMNITAYAIQADNLDQANAFSALQTEITTAP